MRVITGTARGVRLHELKGMETRPTTDRVKEGLFNAIQFDLEDQTVLDLFAGTGQLGIEALSRGAKRAVFVEQRLDAQKLIRENLQRTRLQEQGSVVAGEALSYLASCRETFGMIFLDPPYQTGLLQKALTQIIKFDILKPYGIIVTEHPVEEKPMELAPPYFLYRSYRYGNIQLTLYQRTGEETVL